MKQEEDNWPEYYRESMKDYSEPVPDEIWDSLERDLKHIPFTRYPFLKMAVAAVVFLAVLSSVSLYFLRTPQAEYVREVLQTAEMPQPARYPDVVRPAIESKTVARFEPRTPGKTGETNTMNQPVEEKVLAETSDQHASPAEKVTEQEESLQVVPHITALPSGSGNIESDYSYGRPDFRTRRNKSRTFGIVVGNNPSTDNRVDGFANYAGQGSRDVDPSSVPDPLTGEDLYEQIPAAREAYLQILRNSMEKESQTDIKHKMPFTVGVSFRFRILPNFSVETGLNYTLLSSELRAGTSNDYYVKEQRLHYLGIPLKANWMFLNRKYVSLYLSAGGAVEKSVAGNQKTDFVTDGQQPVHDSRQLKVKPLQWSVSSAIGVQYNATSHIGIFVEPGIVYYFDDGSPVETIRKEKPFNFNLQMGLRFTY